MTTVYSTTVRMAPPAWTPSTLTTASVLQDSQVLAVNLLELMGLGHEIEFEYFDKNV